LRLSLRQRAAGKGRNDEFVNVGNKRVVYHTADGERRASAKHAHPLTMLAKDLPSSMNTSAHEDKVRQRDNSGASNAAHFWEMPRCKWIIAKRAKRH
jgi:hypothetical protein